MKGPLGEKNSSAAIGKEGEEKAITFLREAGYQILERNYRFRRCEVDIIAVHAGILVFLEVKKRKNDSYGSPESFVSDAQQDRIRAAATHYQEETDWQCSIRFDIISIEGKSIRHFEDAF